MVQIFADDMSGRFTQRPAMEAMLVQIQNPIVIIEDISRLARGLETHLQLRVSLANAGGKLESPSIEFDEHQDRKLVGDCGPAPVQKEWRAD